MERPKTVENRADLAEGLPGSVSATRPLHIRLLLHHSSTDIHGILPSTEPPSTFVTTNIQFVSLKQTCFLSAQPFFPCTLCHTASVVRATFHRLLTDVAGVGGHCFARIPYMNLYVIFSSFFTVLPF